MIEGKVHKFRDNIDTDAIIPASCASMSDPAELGRHCMRNIDPEFAGRVARGDIIVAGNNFGCGSSREFAPLAIQGAGVACVVAKSFARIFFRNALNIALPVLACPAAVDGAEEKDLLQIDLDRGEIRNLTRNAVYRARPYPEFIRKLISAGGLLPHARRLLARRDNSGTQGG